MNLNQPARQSEKGIDLLKGSVSTSPQPLVYVKCRKCGRDVDMSKISCGHCDELNFNGTTFQELRKAARRKAGMDD